MSISDSIPPPTREPAPTFLRTTLKRRGATKSKLSLLALAVLLLAAPARANQLWTWTGDCTLTVVSAPVLPCEHAILGVVVTDSYVPGTVAEAPEASAVYVAAIYLDDGGEVFSTFDFARNAITLTLPAASGAADGRLITETAGFRSSSDGTWRAEFENGATGCHFDMPGNPLCNYDVRRINGTWTRVPGHRRSSSSR